MKNNIDRKELFRLACEARKASYSPYSKTSVGAALCTESGNIYTGANIENSAYPMTVCAEQVAIFKAVNAGERKFIAIAVAGGRAGEGEKSRAYNGDLTIYPGHGNTNKLSKALDNVLYM